MKIVIVGAGRIGTNLAKSLTDENHEVYVIEKNPDVGRKIMDKLDVKVVVGNGATPETLEKVNIQNVDLILAVTTSDETNLVVSSLAAHLGAKKRIARVRNTSLNNLLTDIGYKEFHINEIINPEFVAAEEIVNTIRTPGATEVADFADGRVLLRGFDISAESPLCGSRLSDFADEDFPWPFVIVSIVRNNVVMIPKGDSTIEKNDHIYVLLPAQSLGEFLTYVDPNIKMPKKIVIYGSTITGRKVAEKLSKIGKDVILIEEDAVKASEVAGKIGSVRVIHGSASEADILNECGIEATDVFIAASHDDHANLISSVLAKNMGAKATVIITQQAEYMAIIDALNIDAIINPHHIAVQQILRSVRGKGIRSVTKFSECDAEVLEFVPTVGSPITKAPLKDIKFPKDAIVGASYSGSDVHLAKGDIQIKPGEKVIIFCQKSAIKKLQELFTGR